MAGVLGVMNVVCESTMQPSLLRSSDDRLTLGLGVAFMIPGCCGSHHQSALRVVRRLARRPF